MPAGDLITPGYTLCGRCRARPAVLALSDPGALTPRQAEPELLCFDCTEAELERERARAISPHAATIQALARGELEPPFHLLQATEAMLDRLSTPAAARLAKRCRGILPDGHRCHREAEIAGRYEAKPLYCRACVQAERMTPGLGWTPTGEPKGRPVPIARAL